MFRKILNFSKHDVCHGIIIVWLIFVKTNIN